MRKSSFMLDVGFGYPNYLAHITIGIGSRTLWLNIVASNWRTISGQRDWLGTTAGCLSVFTFAITESGK